MHCARTVGIAVNLLWLTGRWELTRTEAVRRSTNFGNGRSILVETLRNVSQRSWRRSNGVHLRRKEAGHVQLIRCRGWDAMWSDLHMVDWNQEHVDLRPVLILSVETPSHKQLYTSFRKHHSLLFYVTCFYPMHSESSWKVNGLESNKTEDIAVGPKNTILKFGLVPFCLAQTPAGYEQCSVQR